MPSPIETDQFVRQADAAMAEIGIDPTVETPPDDPEVTFTGALVLTRAQESEMMQWVIGRVRELEDGLGRERATQDYAAYGQSASLSDLDSFFGRRRLFDLMYHKRVEWRKTAYGEGSIFWQTNLHLPVTRRIVQQQIARATNYFFSTDPWFAATAQGAADEMPADRINRYAQWKFRQAKVKTTFERALEKAFIRGEAVVKTTNVRDSYFYEDLLNVAIGPDGQPIMAEDGDFITDADTWTVATQPDPATGEELPLTNEAGEPVMVLSRDRKTPMPAEELTYETQRVKREKVNYAGPEASVVFYLDFLAPEDAESLDKADCIAHFYDMPAVALTQAYRDRDGDDPIDPEKNWILNLIRESAALNGESDSLVNGLRPEDGERRDNRAYDAQSREGKVPVAEVYFRRDVDGDGNPEEIALFYNRLTGKPIYYDHLPRVSPTGKRPFHVVRVNPVDGRWYGGSQVDLFWDLQGFIDLTMNRWNFSQMSAARIDCVNPAAVYEGDANPHFKVNSGQSYRLKPGKTIDDFWQSKYLTDIKGQDLQAQLEYFQQIATTMSGVTNANDAAMAGLDTTKLATGVRNIEKGGQELFAPLLGHLEEGLNAASEAMLYLLASGMDEAEVFTFFEGDVPGIDEIRPADLAGLKFVVEMELTRYKNEQELQQGLAALDVIDRFYGESPEKQQIIAPTYRNLLKLFGVKHTDTLIQPGLYLPPGGAGMIDPNQANQAVAPKDTRKSAPNL